MPLEATFLHLVNDLRKLRDTLVAVRLTVAEDKPVRGEAALADHLENSILDIMGMLDQALKAARSAQKAVAQVPDLNSARRALAVCQGCVLRIEQQFAVELVSYEKLKDLKYLGSARGGEWLPWSNSVKEGIEQCREPLDGVSKSLAESWQEIAERIGMTSVSVHATNIGQKILSKAADDPEAVHEGMQ